MKTTKTFKNGRLTISIDGHIDSSTAAQLQEEINAHITEHQSETEELVLDIEAMTFISSMGLRGMLQLKQRYPKFRIINCSDNVLRVFEATGFTKILTIEKALPQVSLDAVDVVDGLQDTYQLTDETMLKVYPAGTSKEDVEREVELSREMFVLGVPTAMTFDIVKIGDRYGLIFESVDLQETDAETLGKMMRDLHEHIVEPGGLVPSAIERKKQEIQSHSEQINEEALTKMLQLLDMVPDGSSLLHGNFTAKKVAFQDGAPIMIDMSGTSYGNPILDLAHMYTSLPDEGREQYYEDFLRSYYDLVSEETMAHNRQNIITLANALDYSSNYILDSWDEILSKLHFKMDFAEEVRKLERKRFYLDSNINIDWIASTLGTNRHYVSDYFNKVLHTTFTEYINHLRLEYALELLRSGRIAGADIAYAVGFNSDHTFRRLFKQKYGCTPSQYKTL